MAARPGNRRAQSTRSDRPRTRRSCRRPCFGLARIEPDVANPPGGTFVRAAAGSLTGHAIGAAAHLIRARMPSPPERLPHDGLLRVERAANAAGLTSVI